MDFNNGKAIISTFKILKNHWSDSANKLYVLDTYYRTKLIETEINKHPLWKTNLLISPAQKEAVAHLIRLNLK